MTEQPALPAEIGEVIGGYRLEGVLGQGGMGCVYFARHVLLGRPAAVKVLAATLAVDEQFVSRFFHEAKIVSDIYHPNIVDIIDFVRSENPRRIAYVMEYVEGVPLSEALRHFRFAPQQAINIVLQMSDALRAVHSVGIVHRDLKPANIILAEPLESDYSRLRSIRILDFGIAKSTEPNAEFKTATGAMLGTPAYMAPEQAAGAPVTPATDVYALGELLYELLTGDRAFGGQNLEILRAKMMDGPPALPVSPSVERGYEVCAIARACLASESHERLTLEDLRSALISIGGTEPLDRGNSGWSSQPVQGTPARTFSIGPPTPRNLNTMALPLPPPETPRRSWATGAAFLGFAGLLIAGGLTASSWMPIQIEPVETVASRVAVRLSTKPEHSQVYDATSGEILGTSPLFLEVERNIGRKVTVQASGYQSQLVELTGLLAHHQVTLRSVQIDGGASRALGRSGSARGTPRSPAPVVTAPLNPPSAELAPAPPAPESAQKRSGPIRRSEIPSW